MTGHLVVEEIMSGSVAAPINSAKVQSAYGLRQFVPLTWLALGNFATGTESFMIAALLPGLSASALAGAIVAPERRGTALAIVNGGTSIAVALGVPLGAIVGHTFGWRTTFIAVAIMASIAVAGLSFGIPRGIDKALSAPSIRERLAVIRQAPLSFGFLVAMLWATAPYPCYTYFTAPLPPLTPTDAAPIAIAF